MSTWLVELKSGIPMIVKADDPIKALEKLAGRWFPLREVDEVAVRLVTDTDAAS